MYRYAAFFTAAVQKTAVLKLTSSRTGKAVSVKFVSARARADWINDPRNGNYVNCGSYGTRVPHKHCPSTSFLKQENNVLQFRSDTEFFPPPDRWTALDLLQQL